MTNNTCPICHRQLDPENGAHRNGSKPKPNDFCVCPNCGEALVFERDLTVRQADLNDMMALDEQEREVIGRLQEMSRTMRHENGMDKSK